MKSIAELETVIPNSGPLSDIFKCWLQENINDMDLVELNYWRRIFELVVTGEEYEKRSQPKA